MVDVGAEEQRGAASEGAGNQEEGGRTEALGWLIPPDIPKTSHVLAFPLSVTLNLNRIRHLFCFSFHSESLLNIVRL